METVPCQGQEKVPVLVSICPPRLNVPVALAKRPVPGGYKGEFVVVEDAGAVDLANIDATTNTNKANGARLTSRL